MPVRLFFTFFPYVAFWQSYYLAAVVIRGGSLLAWLRGFAEALFLLPKMLKKRQQINRQRQVSTTYLEQLIINSDSELNQSKNRLRRQILNIRASKQHS